MANEAVLRDRMSDPINMECTELAMEKGTLLAFSGPRGVKPSAADGDIFAGVLHREKITGDGRTQVPVFVDGIFDCACQGAIAIGEQVSFSGPNILKVFTAGDSEDGVAFGKSLEVNTAPTAVNQILIGRN